MADFYRQEINDGHMVLWNTNHAARNALSPSYYEGVIDGLKQAAQVMANQLVEGPENAIATVKSLLENAQSATLEQQFEAECSAMAEVLGG